MLTVEPHIRALIFDCDGTLADTMPLHHGAWREVIQATEEDISEEFLYSLAGTPSERVAAILNETFGYHLDPKQASEQKEATFLRRLYQVRPIEPVVAVARRYKGRLPLAVASGTNHFSLQAILRTIGLANFFDIIIGAEDVTRPKPAPDPFLEAARRLGVSPQYCQVFEDSDLGLEAARRAGMVPTDVRPWLRGLPIATSAF